jgi:hypothetical protein
MSDVMPDNMQNGKNTCCPTGTFLTAETRAELRLVYISAQLTVETKTKKWVFTGE